MNLFKSLLEVSTSSIEAPSPVFQSRAQRMATNEFNSSRVTEHSDVSFNYDEIKCKSCQDTDNNERMICCTKCDSYYHVTCVALDSIPEYEWLCHKCH